MWTVTELFKNTLNRTPDRTALVDPVSERRFSYAEVEEKVSEVASGLRAFDVQKGDRVGIALPNTPEHAFLLLATQRIGAVAVPFGHHSSAEKVRYFVSDSDISLLVFGEEIADQVLELRDELDCETFVATTDVSASDVDQYESLIQQSGNSTTATVAPDDLSIIQYSSGTTGDPKGIKITHRGGVDRALLNIHTQRPHDGETVLGTIPLFHTIAFHGKFLTTILTNGTYVLLPHSDLGMARRVIPEEEVTVLHEAPPIFKQLLELQDEAEGRDIFESVEMVTSVAATMEDELFSAIKREIDPEYFYNTYGMTEIFPPYTKVNLKNRDDQRIFGHAESANAMRIVEIESKDPTAEVEPGEEGELIINLNTPGAFQGYLKEYENAEDATQGDWYFTGDACAETEDGFYVVTGRLSNRIKFLGDNIYPKNVESVLLSHPSVEDTAVVGIDDEEWGEVPKAYVVAEEDLTETELQEYCIESESLEEFKHPREVEFVSTLDDVTDVSGNGV